MPNSIGNHGGKKLNRKIEPTGQLRRVKAIVFDTFGTVVDWRSSLIAQFEEFGRQRAIPADWTALVDAWRGGYEASKDKVRTGAVPWMNLDALHREALDGLIDAFDVKGLMETDRDWMSKGWHRLSAWPDAVEGLTRLKRDFVIGPLSNGNVALLVNMAKHAGLPWDMIFSTELFRRYKPHPDTYLGVGQLLDLEPGEVMLAAAHNYDLSAAQKLGLRTAFIPRPQEYGPEQSADLEPLGDWDLVVRDLVELAEQLGA